MAMASVPGAEHYREIADKLREAAWSCQFADARKEIMHLADRLESQADHLDHRTLNDGYSFGMSQGLPGLEVTAISPLSIVAGGSRHSVIPSLPMI
jgi:hypothetical protein